MVRPYLGSLLGAVDCTHPSYGDHTRTRKEQECPRSGGNRPVSHLTFCRVSDRSDRCPESGGRPRCAVPELLGGRQRGPFRPGCAGTRSPARPRAHPDLDASSLDRLPRSWAHSSNDGKRELGWRVLFAELPPHPCDFGQPRRAGRAAPAGGHVLPARHAQSRPRAHPGRLPALLLRQPTDDRGGLRAHRPRRRGLATRAVPGAAEAAISVSQQRHGRDERRYWHAANKTVNVGGSGPGALYRSRDGRHWRRLADVPAPAPPAWDVARSDFDRVKRRDGFDIAYAGRPGPSGADLACCATGTAVSAGASSCSCGRGSGRHGLEGEGPSERSRPAVLRVAHWATGRRSPAG